MYPTIDLGIVRIPLYITLFLIGFVLMVVWARKIAERYNYPKADILYLSLYSGIGILIGAKIMYFVSKLPIIIPNFDVYIEYWKTNPTGALNYSFGGLVFYGGLIGALLAYLFYCKWFKVDFGSLINIISPVIPLVHSFGRIGCFLGGCCYGIEYHGKFAVQFPENEFVEGLNACERFPVQLLEAFINLLLFFFLFYFARKIRKPGTILGIYLICYSIIRFSVEFLRGDVERGILFGVSTSQWISLLLIPIGIYLIIRKLKPNNE